MRPVPIVYDIDVDQQLLHGNPDAVAGRIPATAVCPLCEQRKRVLLRPGRWQLAHTHGGGWTARQVDKPIDEVGALAAGLAEAINA